MKTQECGLELKGAREERQRRERCGKQHIKQMKWVLITESTPAAKSVKAFGRAVSREKRSRSSVRGRFEDERNLRCSCEVSQLLRAVL